MWGFLLVFNLNSLFGFNAFAVSIFVNVIFAAFWSYIYGFAVRAFCDGSTLSAGFAVVEPEAPVGLAAVVVVAGLAWVAEEDDAFCALTLKVKIAAANNRAKFLIVFIFRVLKVI